MLIWGPMITSSYYPIYSAYYYYPYYSCIPYCYHSPFAPAPIQYVSSNGQYYPVMKRSKNCRIVDAPPGPCYIKPKRRGQC